MYPAAGQTRALVPMTRIKSILSEDSIQLSIVLIVFSGNGSPNQTTPGRKRPVLHSGQCGSCSTSIGGIGTLGSDISTSWLPGVDTSGGFCQFIAVWSERAAVAPVLSSGAGCGADFLGMARAGTMGSLK